MCSLNVAIVQRGAGGRWRRWRPLARRVVLCGGLLAAGAAAQAQGAVFRCVDAAGHPVIQGTPCALVPVAPPVARKPPCVLSAEKLATAVRQEEQFLGRFPSQESHHLARYAALREVNDKLRLARSRYDELVLDRKPLDVEREFYRGKSMPKALQDKIDAGDARFAALVDVFRNLEHELADIEAKYLCERETFNALWAGAAPGTSACTAPACTRSSVGPR